MDISRLISILKDPPRVPYPVILPDFFVDHFVLVPTFAEFIKNLENLADQGGGNILQNEQFIRRGGNCVNTASALVALGLKPKIIVTTDESGASLLRTMVPSELELNHVHTNGRLSATVSIETEYQNRKINLMVSDSGSAAHFDFSDLSREDLQLVDNCGILVLVNLNHNQHGASLAKQLFTYVKETSKAKTLMDIGDPSNNPGLIEPLVNEVLREGLVDILSLNENEAGWLAWSITGNDSKWKNLASQPDCWMPAAKMIGSELGIRIDLHTPQFSATILDDEIVSIPAFNVPTKIVCGAGDAWNAGNIFGELHHLSTSERLVLANALAALYVSSEDASHPTRDMIIEFLGHELE